MEEAPVSEHGAGGLKLTRDIIAIYEESRFTYGAPRVHAMLKRRGIRTSQKRVAGIMSEHGLKGISKNEKRHRAKAQTLECDNACDLVKCDFSAKGPNQIWFADTTYVRTYRGWLCLAATFDIRSRIIVGWSMGAIPPPWDNAVTESLMSTIKAECADIQTFKTGEEAKLEIFDCIKTFYNRLRIHSVFKYLSPTGFEAIMKQEAVPA